MARKIRWVAWLLVFAMIFQVSVTAFAEGLPEEMVPPAESATQSLPVDGQEQSQSETPVNSSDTEQKEDNSSQDKPSVGDGSSSEGASSSVENPASSQPSSETEIPEESKPESKPAKPGEGELPKDESPSSVPEVPTQPENPGESLPPESSTPPVEPDPPVVPIPPVVEKPSIDTLFGEELLLAIRELTDEEYVGVVRALTSEQIESIIPLLTEEDEQRLNQLFKVEIGEPFDPNKLIYYPATDVNVGSIILPSMLPQMAMRMMRSAVATQSTMVTPPTGVTLTKTATRVTTSPDSDPIYQIDLTVESESQIIGTPVPCDIALVLDRSGSMDEYGFELIGEPLKSRYYEMVENGERLEIWYDTSKQSWVAWKWFVVPYIGKVDISGKTIYTKRIDVLNDTVNSFVDQVAEKSASSKIAIVSYASNAEVNINLTPVAQAANIKSAINGLKADGATATDKGMEQVHNHVFNTAPDPSRARVVIMFTDGVPTTGNTFNDDVANRTKATATDLKSDKHGCTIYTVGVFDTATINGSLKTKVDAFMTAVATPATQTKKYYLTADSISSLNDIFTAISTETGTVIRNLDVKDYLDARFEYVTGTSTATSVENECLTWSNITVQPGVANAFHTSFQVKPKADYIGGINIPTNKAGISAIYDAAGNNIGSFPQPTVNVPVKFAPTSLEDYILYGETTPRTKTEVENGVYTFVNKPEYGYPDGMFTYDWDKTYVSQSTNVSTYQVSVTCKPSTDSSTWVTKTATYTVRPVKPILTGSEHTIFLSESIAEGTKHSTTGEFVSIMLPPTDVSNEMLPNDAISQDHLTNYFNNLAYVTDLNAATRPEVDTTYPVTAKYGDLVVASGIPAKINVIAGRLSVTKTGATDDQAFVFKIENIGSSNQVLNTFYCVIDGNGTSTVIGLPKGTYVVTEVTDWSWRYQLQGNNGVSVTLGNKGSQGEYVAEKAVTMNNKKAKFNWFNSSKHVTNDFTVGGGNS